jgi:predicted metal-dependent enzyme (double-stranded beta helix superfamily)
MSANSTLPRLHESFAGFLSLSDTLIRASGLNEERMCGVLSRHLRPLLSDLSWIPAEFLEPPGFMGRRECLYEAQDGLFSVGLFDWNPGYRSRIHDHHAWAVVGNMTGVLRSEHFSALGSGWASKNTPDAVLPPGASSISTPRTGDIHRLSVESHERSLSIHVYGSRFNSVNRKYYMDLEDAMHVSQ